MEGDVENPIGRSDRVDRRARFGRRWGGRAWARAIALGIVLLLLGTVAVPGLARPDTGGRTDIGAPAGTAPFAGNSTPLNSSNLNNTTSHLGDAITAFATWFVRGLTLLVVSVFAVLLAGGILNYLLVGRKRGEWSPAHSAGVGTRPPPSGASGADGPSPGSGPP